jgi:hypothetical protein
MQHRKLNRSGINGKIGFVQFFLPALFILVFLFILSYPVFSSDFSTDFDGTGSGSVISVDSPTDFPIQIPNAPAYPHWRPSTYVQYEQARYQQQEEQRAARLKQEEAEKERLAKMRELEEELAQVQQAEKVIRIREKLRELEKAQDKTLNHDLRLKGELVDELPKFNNLLIYEKHDYDDLLRKLSHEMNHIHVPSPMEGRRYIPRVLFLGWTGTPEEALEMQQQQAKDPFNGLAYNAVYGFALPSTAVDFGRVLLDHFLLSFNLPTPESELERTLAQLKGATIGELVVHSNGAAIAETMIENGMINVQTLRILGGDGSLMNLESLDNIADRNYTQVYVYANAGDPVPMAPLGWSIRGAVESLSNPQSFDLAEEHVDVHDFTYAVLGLEPPSWSSNLHVTLLSTPWNPLNPSNVVRNHVYSTYYGLLNAQRIVESRH